MPPLYFHVEKETVVAEIGVSIKGKKINHGDITGYNSQENQKIQKALQGWHSQPCSTRERTIRLGKCRWKFTLISVAGDDGITGNEAADSVCFLRFCTILRTRKKIIA